MSGSAVTAAALNPQPERWGAMRAGNIDSRVRDATPDLASINDAASTVSCSVQRRDGQVLGSQDLHWLGSSSLDPTNRIITVMLAAGTAPPLLTATNPVDYLVTITAQTTGGRTLSWDAYQLVVAQIG